MKHEYTWTLTRYNLPTPADIPASDPFAYLSRSFGVPRGTLASFGDPFCRFQNAEIRAKFTAHAVIPMCGFPQSHNELRGWPPDQRLDKVYLLLAVFFPPFGP
jgi:hypothetical protein